MKQPSKSLRRGVKKNWKDNIKMSESEMKYWMKFLKENEERLIQESICV